MKKIFRNGCETGVESLKTSPFKPVSNLDKYVHCLNSLYEQDYLFTFEIYKDEVVLHASTYLLAADLIDEENAAEEITSVLEHSEMPDDLKQILVDWDWSGYLPVGDILPLLIGGGQNVTVQITDPYENSEFVIET
jgi:hypothetical protein